MEQSNDITPQQEFMQPTEETKPKITPAKLSLIFSLIPLVLLSYCAIRAQGSFAENNSGAVWWLAVMYYGSIGIPLLALAVIFGIRGLRTPDKRFAIISLIIKALTIPFVLLLIQLVSALR